MTTVKLLPTIVKRAKDAAQSVKRRKYESIRLVRENTLTEILNLPNFAVYGYAVEKDAEQDILHLHCKLTVDVGICPCCKGITEAIKEYKDRCVRDVDFGEMRTFVHFQIRRFECSDCAHRFTEELLAVKWRRHQTMRFEEKVYERCLESSKKAVATDFHLSYSTVNDIFKRFAKQKIDGSDAGLVRVLGMDEISIVKRHKQFALVLSDLERRCVIAVLPSREQKEIKRWFDTLSEEQKCAIQVVSIDMWRPYHSFAKKYLPKADIVADRFHVMKQLNEQLSKARRQIQRNADDDTKAALKGCRWLLVRNRSELSDEQRDKLQIALDADAQLRDAYFFKEEFRRIFDKIHDRDKARRFLDLWVFKVRKSGNKYLIDFVKTFINWFDEILNYFDERITNGFVEGMNRAIRFVSSRAFGFRNFDNFRLQILAQHGPPF